MSPCHWAIGYGVYVVDDTTDLWEFNGIHQGCILFLLLFNLYSLAILEEASMGMELWIELDGRLIISSLRHGDGTVILSDGIGSFKLNLDTHLIQLEV